MKSISWITPEWFIDVDIPVIARLQSLYKINLIIVLPYNSIENQQYVESFLGDADNVCVSYFHLKYRTRSLKNIICYNRIISMAKAFKPDMYYISFLGMPYALPFYLLRLPIKKCVVPCHNVSTPKGATSERVANIYTSLWLNSFKNIQVFSKNQYEVLVSRFRDKNILLAYLLIKDYGNPNIVDRDKDGVIKFLFFGNILRYKRLDLLLNAVDVLFCRGIRNFRVIVAGNCNDWNAYLPLLKHRDLIETRIERIPNEEVADLFASCHYLVLPYQDIAQSGAITVAFRYNLPTIVSDIEQFNEFVVDGQTSLSFKSESEESLADIMQYAIEKHKVIYPKLCRNQKHFVEDVFSENAIISKYKSFFDRIK